MALEKTQAQLVESQNFVYKLQMVYENEHRTLEQTRLELKSALDLIIRLEDEKIRGQNEQARLQMTWENALLNHDSLINQAKETKLINVQLQQKNQVLESNLAEQKMLNKIMEDTLNDLRNQMSEFIPMIQRFVKKLLLINYLLDSIICIIHSNVDSLKREHESLKISIDVFNKFKCMRQKPVVETPQTTIVPIVKVSYSTIDL